MNWQRKRFWVGLLALLAPLPLPFNEMSWWPATLAYVAVVLGWLLALSRGADLLLKPWVLNLAGGLYLPVLLVDLASAEGGQVLRPLVHVAMFATAAKLFALRGERDKWHAVLGAFFLFVAGMGSSVHPVLVAYMLVFTTVAISALVEFAEAQSMRSLAEVAATPGKARLVSGIVAVTIVGCGVLFPLLPRVAQPYVAGGGAVDLGGSGGVAAFVDDLTLDSIGRIRTDRGIALRLVFDGPVPGEIRLKGSSYDLYRDHRWMRTEGLRFKRTESGWAEFEERAPRVGEVAVFSRVKGAPMMPLLSQGVDVEAGSPWIGISAGGDLRPVRWRGTPLRYRVGYGRLPTTHAASPPNPETLDPSGITPAIAGFAERFLSGSDTPLSRVTALERHLQEEFSYSLDLDLDPDSPVEDFLLRKRSGHCEYFASGMVMLLRSQGIPARVVSGFLGAEGNPLEAFYVVRNANAHAWVEAWVEGDWRILDPTPAAARPAPRETSGSGLWQRLLDTWDWMIYRWDRYVLTYSSEDQTSVFSAIGGWFRELWSRLTGGAEVTLASESGPVTRPPDTVSESGVSENADAAEPGAMLLIGVLALIAAATGWLWFGGSRRHSATTLFLEVRKAALHAGAAADETRGPAGVVESWSRLAPDLETHLRPILDAYLEESFGGREIARHELVALEEEWQSVRRQSARAA